MPFVSSSETRALGSEEQPF